MNQPIVIPVAVLRDVREALISHMSHAIDRLDSAIVDGQREHHPEWFLEPRAELELLWKLLDSVGWEPGGEHEVQIDAAESGRLLEDAIDDHLVSYETWEEEADLTDASRAERGIPPRKAEIIKRHTALRLFAIVLATTIGELPEP